MEDEQALFEVRRRELWWALRTRILSDAEMDTVKSYDYTLTVPNSESFSRAEAQRVFIDALLAQFKMRLAKEHALAILFRQHSNKVSDGGK